MLRQIFWSIFLAGISALMHGMYTLSLMQRLKRRLNAPRRTRPSAQWPFLAETISLLMLLHILEATVWAVFFVWKDGFPDFASALYFSLVSYATVGYGDVLLPANLRLIGALEGTAGTLIAGWSVALILAALNAHLRPPAHPPA